MKQTSVRFWGRIPGATRKPCLRWHRVLSLAGVVALLASCGGGEVGEDLRREPLSATVNATTTQAPAYDRDDLYRFFSIAFGAAPGVTYMGSW